ncbi:unnamed protein product [Lota lota]
MDSSLAVSIQACGASSDGGTKDKSTLSRDAIPETASPALNPKFRPHNKAESPLLGQTPSVLSQVSEMQNSAEHTLANALSSRAGSVSEECLPQTVWVADPVPRTVTVRCQSNQAQRPVNRSPAAAPSTKAMRLSTTENACHATLQSNSDNEALIVAEPSTGRQVPGPLHVASSKTAAVPSIPQPRGVSLATVEAKAPSLTAEERPDDQSYFLCEGEEMEQEGSPGEAPSQGPASGQVSSAEEGSDDEEESECDKTDYGRTTPSPAHQHGQSRTDRQEVFLKVRRWIADRVVASASPASPFASSPSPGPSSASDWSTPRNERASPLRGPHGKFLSLSSSSPADQSTPHRPRGEKDMAELAKHEADIEHRTQSLKKEGFWSTKRLTRLTEPVRPKVHWDYLCEEMQWLSADFAQERRWKRGVARKVVRMVMRYHEDLRQKEEKAKRDEHSKVRRIASSIAKEVRAFWSSVEKVCVYKQQSRLEEKRKKALDLQLDFIVGQTEKYSDLLSQSLATAAPPESTDVQPKRAPPSAGEDDDRDFEPPCEEEDDEETIDVEEQQEGNDAESQQREIELLKQEGELPLEDLLRTLKGPADSASEEGSDDTTTSVEEEDGEFNANEEDAEDQEDTIDAQEKVEGTVDHAEELDDLAKEGDMSMDELLEKYKGAYTSDFEEPSGSASKASSDSEVSGDEEEETDEDESDVETNSSSSDSPEESEEEEDSEKDEDPSEEEEEEEEEEGSSEDSCGDEGMEVLLKEGDHSPPSAGSRPKKEISHIAATAESLQPKGYTLATTKVKTPIPFLLDGTLREYQHIGLDWLVTMYEKKLNGILADEMGLGKTIQTIALLAHLACEKGNWGPHLIIVPTSVMLNWEMELKRWCPGFKILTYFGSQKERKMKRQGWTKPNAFHVCVTSYKLVLQDHQAFRRKSWRYLILDEAQNIKNFKSQRWQSLLNFNSHRRLLLTGTPLQNSLMELWSLMHFLMPHVFQSHREFKEWFSNPLTGMIEGSQEYNEGLIKRLHKVLRPFLLRRIKVDVEKQMPKKYEHVVRCRLSKRQRFLYDDFMAQAATRETLASGHFMSVINILMQLRKVCNHPNLFDPRPIQSPFITKPIVFHTASLVQEALEVSPLKRCDLSMFDLLGLEGRVSRYRADVFMPRHKVGRQLIQEIMESPEPPPRPKPVRMKVNRTLQPPPKTDSRPVLLMNKPTCPVPPAAQTPKPPSVTETPQPPAPVVQQVVCSVATTPPPPRPLVHTSPQTAVRSSGPRPILTVRAPTAPGAPSVPAQPTPIPSQVLPQRVLLSPDMQARLPSGEVVSIAQLASLAGRPMSSCQGSKPVTFQLQGNKLTLSGAQIHQVPLAPPRSVQGNVMHLVSSGGQHHLISQPAQVAVLSTASTHPVHTSPAPIGTQLPLSVSSQVSSSMVSSPGIVKIVVRQATGKEGGPVPTLAVAPSPRVAPLQFTPVRTPVTATQRTPGPATATYTMAPPRIPSASPGLPQPPRPILKVVQAPAVTPSSSSSSASTSTSSSSSKSSAVAPRDSSASSKPAPLPKASPASRAPPRPRVAPCAPPRSPFYMSSLAELREEQHRSKLDFLSRVNDLHCGARPIYGLEVLDFLTFLPGSKPSPAPVGPLGEWGRSGYTDCLLAQSRNQADHWLQSRALKEAIHSPEQRLTLLYHMIDRFTFVIPPVEAAPITMHCCHPPPSLSHKQAVFSSTLSTQLAPLTRNLHRIQCNMRTHFPDLRLIQYDCGKLQTLHTLLRRLKTGGHRVLIFTQMTRMLDVLEQFLNYHGHIYLRLDGSTRVEQRQSLMERFNADRRIFCFILSTRSGGVGVNLTGADTVVFYDSDWNPTMDAQAQDRCHRIGQTRDVHIYRLISERTVEENILKKANQKRMLGDMAIDGGNFTTAFFKEQTIRELFDVNEGEKREAVAEVVVAPPTEDDESAHKQSTTILEQALCRAEDEEDIVAASQAKAEQVAELAEFNENIPLDDGGDQEEVEELSKAEQEIAALVEQLTPIERYAMNFLEASLEDVCKEELKQAEEQVEAARKGLDQAKEEGLKHNASSDDDMSSPPASVETPVATPARRGRKPKDKSATSTRTSGRLRGASPPPEPSPPPHREVPERPRSGLRGRPPSKDSAAAAAAAAASPPSTSTSTATPTCTEPNTKSASSKHSKDSSPTREPTKGRTLNRSLISPVPSPAPSSPARGRPQTDGPTDCHRSAGPEERAKEERVEKLGTNETESNCPVDHQMYSAREDTMDRDALSTPPASSRSPRKRQSADGEVLKGLSEDSPSAKVLRKLPGRLVTVVTDKEPRKRRRRASGTGGHGSSEEATEEQAGGSTTEPGRDTPQSPENKPKGPPCKDQDSSPALPTHPQPPRSYHPYSPPHVSPDMPVLRNLPVRRRLETESRMAAQLSEQQQQHQLGRGRGATQPRKMDTPPGRDPGATGTGPSENSVADVPVKRKRGRPPKTPPQPLPRPSPPPPPPPKAEASPTISPKRKRGRPRKDSSTVPDIAGQKSNNKTTASADPGSKTTAQKPGSSQVQSPPTKPLSTPPVQTVVGPSQASLPTPPVQTVVGPSQASLPTPPVQTVVGPSQGSLPTKPLSSPPVQTVVGPSQASLPSKPLSTPPNPKPSPTNSSGPAAGPQLPALAPPARPESEAAGPPPPPPPATDLITTTAVRAPVPIITTASTAIPAAKQTLTAPTQSDVNGSSTTVKTTTPPVERSMLVSTTPSTTSSRPLHVTPSNATSVVAAAAVSAPPTKGSVTLSKTTNCSPVPTSKSMLVKNMAPSSAQPSATPTPPSESTTSTPTIMETAPPTEGPASAVTTSTTATSSTTTSGTMLNVDKVVSSASESCATVTSQTAVKSVPSAVEKTIAVAPSLSIVNKVTEPIGPTKTSVTTVVPEKPVTTFPPEENPEKTAAPVTTLVQTTSLTKPVMVNTAASSSTVSPPANITTPATSAKMTSSLSSKEVKVAEQISGGTLSTSMSTVAATPHVTSSTKSATAPEKSAAASSSSTLEPIAVATLTKVSPNTQETPATTAAVPGSTETATRTFPPPFTIPTPTVVPSPVQKVASHNTPPEASSSAQTEALPQGSTPAPSADCLASSPTEPVSNMESEKEASVVEASVVEAKMDGGAPIQDKKAAISNSQAKKKARESSEAKDPPPSPTSPRLESKPTADVPGRGSKQESDGDEKASRQKRSRSRQSSQDSARSSSPSSGCSTATLTRQAHHKKTYENRHPTKKKRVDSPEPGRKQQQKEEKARAGREQGKKHTATSQRRSRSPSSSSDSDRSEDRKEHRLTRSAKRGLQDHGVAEGNRPRKRTTRSSERRNAAVSTGGESGSDTSSVRTTGKHRKPQANSFPLVPPEPEVLGKRCSALNAAAKLLAMKGRVDTPGHTLRKDPKAAGSSPATDKKPKCKSVPASPQTNSVNISNNRASGSKPPTPSQSGRGASRSTRRCPGSLLPPLETEYKRSRGKKEGKEGESSRGHSACSSASSDGEDGGGRSSQSRSSSDSSRRSPSLSSQSTGPRGSRSRAVSSGSERERSSERRSTRRDRKDRGSRSGEGRRESRRSDRRSHKLSQEVSSSSGAEGTPDRVLRSVAALAAVHARSPAASTRSSASSTRSSAGQQRHNKT